jgi:EAL domain-containing protein (putative c-di-GMP-specific phosphodiesterase class I)
MPAGPRAWPSDAADRGSARSIKVGLAGGRNVVMDPSSPIERGPRPGADARRFVLVSITESAECASLCAALSREGIEAMPLHVWNQRSDAPRPTLVLTEFKDGAGTPARSATLAERTTASPSDDPCALESFFAGLRGAIAAARDHHVAVVCVAGEAPAADQKTADERRAAALELLREEITAERGAAAASGIASSATDEFVVMVPDLVRVEDAAKLAQRLLQRLTQGDTASSSAPLLAASIGIASYPTDAGGAEDLFQKARTAARQARQEGRGTIRFAARATNLRVLERLTLEAHLRRALERGQLLTHYQPRVEIASRTIVGFEALVRWKHPDFGMVGPGQFIPIAEESGLIVPIGEWVLESACRQAQAWREAGLPPVRMAVNLSAVQFRDPGLFDTIQHVLASTGFDPHALELELTESILMQEPRSAVETLQRIKSIGIHLAIDDFGTGYSSLSYLKRFPIDSLKIDQSFVRELTTNADDAAIATSILLMGRSLKLRVVAEGVETPSQLALLRVMKCDEVQGYLFSPPVPAEEAARMLAGGLAEQLAA